MFRKVFNIVLFLIVINLVAGFSFGFNYDNFEFVRFENQSDKQFVVYELRYPDLGMDFEMISYFEGVQLEKKCEKVIESTGEISAFYKLQCEFDEKKEGLYTFEAVLSSKEGEIVKSIITKKYLGDDCLELEFIENKDSTTILINVVGDEKKDVFLEIPKEVIEYLDENNKNSLMSSNYEYEIIESDPLIAWNVEPPATINTTINKKISIEDQKKFSADIKDSKEFLVVKLFVSLLIILILGVIFFKIFKKK